jgi:hypothetical protein
MNVSVKPQEAKRAQQILDEQVDYVLQKPGEPDCVYQAREKITEALLQLTAELSDSSALKVKRLPIKD